MLNAGFQSSHDIDYFWLFFCYRYNFLTGYLGIATDITQRKATARLGRYLEEAERLADHVHVIDHGRVIAAGTPAAAAAEGKSSTALALAQSLGLPPEAIESVRDRQRQSSEFAVPANHLDRHAIHRISIRDAGCAIYLEARVLDAAPYVRGVGQLLRALQTRRLAPGLHAIGQLIQDGWL